VTVPFGVMIKTNHIAIWVSPTHE
ncbi:uncharacterized protein METZ01_LOCUS249445, partial [marine metagenome]